MIDLCVCHSELKSPSVMNDTISASFSSQQHQSPNAGDCIDNMCPTSFLSSIIKRKWIVILITMYFFEGVVCYSAEILYKILKCLV